MGVLVGIWQTVFGVAFSFVALSALAGEVPGQPVQDSVAPAESLVVGAKSASWTELLGRQTTPAKPPSSSPFAAVGGTIEVAVVDVELPRTRERRGVLEPSELAGGGPAPCNGLPSDTPESHVDSQLDVPDSQGFSYIPPDVAGAVGPSHLMTMLHNKVRITDRLAGSHATVDTSVFWSPLGADPMSPTTTYPRVFYDARDGRWIASSRNGVGSSGSTSIFFAISQTSDPTGTWDFYAFPADPSGASFADWAVLGYNATWITLTANMFSTPSGSSFLGAKMWTIDKATALVPGGPITVSVFPTGFLTAVHGSGGSSPHPARTFDDDPTLWLVNDGFTSGGTFLLQLTRITGTGAAPVASGLPGSPFGGNTSFCFVSSNWSATQRTIAQLGESRFLSPFSVRVASVAVRNGKIWVANSGGLPGPSTNNSPTANGVVWHELDPSLPFPAAPGEPGSMVVQSGVVTDGNDTMCAFPSLAVNCAEDVLLGFANGDATRWPRACFAFRRGSDPLGSMGSIQELKAGESTYWKNFGVGTTAPYGRYTSAAVDPCDDQSLWTLQEYADQRVGPGDNDSRWGTRWGWLGGPRFFQVDFYGAHAPQLPSSTWGDLEFVACPPTVPRFLNLVARETSSAPAEWLVQNMMLPALIGPATVTLSRFIDLAPLGVSTGVPLASLEYQLVVTELPFASMPTPGPDYVATEVTASVYDQHGYGEVGPVIQYPTDPGPGPVVETGSGAAPQRESLYREDVPDIDEGCDECGPVSVTRSLRWMHDKGLIDLGATTNADLIASFKAASRWAKARGGVPKLTDFLKAKLKLTKELNVVNKFMARRPGDVPPGDYETRDGTAINKGGDPTFQFIKRELKRMEDVEIVVGWLDGNGSRKNGHVMTVIGFEEDTSNGKKEIWVQDNDQTKAGDKDRRRSTRYQDGNPATLKDLPRNRVEMVVSESPSKKKLKAK